MIGTDIYNKRSTGNKCDYEYDNNLRHKGIN